MPLAPEKLSTCERCLHHQGGPFRGVTTVISRIEEKDMQLSVFYYCIFAVMVLTHLCVICCHFCCPMFPCCLLEFTLTRSHQGGQKFCHAMGIMITGSSARGSLTVLDLSYVVMTFQATCKQTQQLAALLAQQYWELLCPFLHG